MYGFLVLLRQGLDVVALPGLPLRCRESGFRPRISGSFRNPLFTKASRSSVFILDFFHSLAGWGAEGMLAATIREQILPFHYGVSSFSRRPSNPWIAKPSSSKSKGSPLTSARGLCQWRVVAARVDSLFLPRRQKQPWLTIGIDLFE
jgi:hypothetical protein